MKQMENAVKIAEFKYTPAMHTLVWLFDRSSCHRAYAQDALNSNNMNVKPVMTDTVWAGKVQRLVFHDGVPKGMKQVLEERGINTGTFKADDMRVILANHDDFRVEKTIIEHFLSSCGHQVHFIPKFHCELNPIERVWGQAKRYTRSYTNFTLPGLRRIMETALDSVTLNIIRKYFARFGSMRGHTRKVIRLVKKLRMQLKCTNHTGEYLMKIFQEHDYIHYLYKTV